MQVIDAEGLRSWIHDATERSFALVDDLRPEQWSVPRSPLLTPFIWELAHVAWFHERWILRHALGQEPLDPNIDTLYDSTRVPHPTRWDLDDYEADRVFAYVREISERILVELEREPGDELRYFVQLGVFHEDMHAEAFAWMRQTLAYPAPLGLAAEEHERADPIERGALNFDDARVDAATYRLGALRESGFVFDNEKWAREVQVGAFGISQLCVSEAEFAGFVADDGYSRRELWSDTGWEWRERNARELPAYWRNTNGKYELRCFDRWLPISAERAVIHVCAHEADAWCSWAGRRLPSEAEWELAVCGPDKARFPWGAEEATRARANVGFSRLAAIDRAALGEGAAFCGARHMIGNVWEWTASTFEPFPGFTPDPYKQYSEPFFGTRRVLRGGSWATSSRLLRSTWRNFFEPFRSDIFAGFRSCALET